MMCPQRDGGEPQICHSDCKLRVLVPNCVAFSKEYVPPLVRQLHRAAAHTSLIRCRFIPQLAAQQLLVCSGPAVAEVSLGGIAAC